ncbi:unnamed protein product, partial [Ectocarpus sp. 12 AP-2014]
LVFRAVQCVLPLLAGARLPCAVRVLMGPLVCFARAVPRTCRPTGRKLSSSTAMGTLRRSSAYDPSDTTTATSTCGGSRNSSSASTTMPTAARVPVQPAVWNTVSGCLEPLPDPSTGMLKWYSCGPTVYDSAH